MEDVAQGRKLWHLAQPGPLPHCIPEAPFEFHARTWSVGWHYFVSFLLPWLDHYRALTRLLPDQLGHVANSAPTPSWNAWDCT